MTTSNVVATTAFIHNNIIHIYPSSRTSIRRDNRNIMNLIALNQKNGKAKDKQGYKVNEQGCQKYCK